MKLKKYLSKKSLHRAISTKTLPSLLFLLFLTLGLITTLWAIKRPESMDIREKAAGLEVYEGEIVARFEATPSNQEIQLIQQAAGWQKGEVKVEVVDKELNIYVLRPQENRLNSEQYLNQMNSIVEGEMSVNRLDSEDDLTKTELVQTTAVEKINLEMEQDFKKVTSAFSQIKTSKLSSQNGKGGIKYIEPNYLVTALFTPNDRYWNDLWGLHNTGQDGGVSDADIDAPEAWDIHQGSSEIVVGVIDTGVDYNHIDLKNNMWVNPDEIPGNGQDDDGNGYTDDVYGINGINDSGDPMDDNGHGTHCAGTIAAVTNNQNGVAGVCPNCKIMALKFLDATGTGQITAAIKDIDYAVRNGAKVLSNSWGGGSYSQALQNKINWATEQGTLFVAAAGNDNTSQERYPASYDNVLSVAATDNRDQKASFSNYAPTVDVAAPGVSILSTMSEGTIWEYYTSKRIIEPGTNAKYMRLSGTSMACPHVAGLAGLLYSKHKADPIFSPLLATVHIKNSVEQINDPKLKVGRINAYSAIVRELGAAITIKAKTVDDNGSQYENGEIEPGESFNLSIELINGGYLANNVVASLVTEDNYITIINNTATYGSLGSLESKESSVPFRLSASGNMPNSHVITISLFISYEEENGESFTEELQLILVSSPDFTWPKRLDISQYLKFADLDLDGTEEVIIGYDEYGIGVYPQHDDLPIWTYKMSDFEIEPSDWGFNNLNIGDIDGDGYPEIIVNLELEYTYVDRHSILILDRNGRLLTKEPFSAGPSTTNGTTLADLNNDGVYEVIYPIVCDSSGSKSYRYKICLAAYKFHKDGSGKLDPELLWKRPLGDWSSDPHEGKLYDSLHSAVGDIDNNGDLEVVSVINKWYLLDPRQATTSVLYITDALTGNDHGVTIEKDIALTAPTLGDIDNDGDLEIVVGEIYFPAYRPVPEVLDIWGKARNLYVFNHDGSIYPGWPKDMSDRCSANGEAYCVDKRQPDIPLVLADVDNDGNLEIFVDTYNDSDPTFRQRGWLRLFSHNGNQELSVKNFVLSPKFVDPFTVEAIETIAGPTGQGWTEAYGQVQLVSVFDIDNDGQMELIIVSRDCVMHAYKINGVKATGFPKKMTSGLSIDTWAIGPSENNKIAIAIGVEGGAYLYETDVGFSEQSVEWINTYHDNKGSSNYNAKEDLHPPSPSPTPSPVIGHNPKGYLDKADCEKIEGWACDEDNYNTPLTVRIYADEQFINSTQANKPREAGVGSQCGGNHNHGFSINTPNSLKDGNSHQIKAEGVNIGSGSNTQLINIKTLGPCNLPSPTPTSTPYPTPTTPPEGDNMTIKFKVQAVGGSRSPKKFKAKIRKGSQVLFTDASIDSPADTNGVFTINIDTSSFCAQGGAVDLLIKSGSHLQKKYAGLTLTCGLISFDFTADSTNHLIAGDVNGDNILDIVDIASILTLFTDLSIPVDPQTPQDINFDNYITIEDIAFTLINYKDIEIPGDN